MTENNLNPTGDNRLLAETHSTRTIGWLERTVGPDNYRILKGLVKTPASIIGMILIVLFILVAIFAPIIAPPVGHDPYKMPRDGFMAEPKYSGAPWRKNVREVPLWYETLTGHE